MFNTYVRAMQHLKNKKSSRADINAAILKAMAYTGVYVYTDSCAA